ncbi:MAG TPA: helix-turn-helix transcriptional regulator [Clostridiales bacterium]|nr:helix-turn-helix transcriptional regulator [Clostridiales bacterium]
MHSKQQKMYFFPEKLKKQLELIPYHAVTIVEAPSGFGKTTAIMEYLSEKPDTKTYWYTCIGEPPNAVWEGICRLLAKIDNHAAENLKNLNIFELESIAGIPSILTDIQCETETYIAIDNFHLFKSENLNELVNTLSFHTNPHLRFIFITQRLDYKNTFHNNRIMAIKPECFLFDLECTSKLLRTEGINISREELDELFSYTGGWAAAIKAQILYYREAGTFGHFRGTEQLVETAILNQLSKEEKEFFISLALLDSFTPRQAALMLGIHTLPESLDSLLKNHGLVRYSPENNQFTLNNTLKSCLRNHFDNFLPADYQKRILFLVGKSCADISDYYSAARFFFKIGDFDSILSLPFTEKYIISKKESGILEFINELIEYCPEDVFFRNPNALYVFCLQMFAGGYFNSYLKLYRIIGEILRTKNNISDERYTNLKSEYAFLTMLGELNDTGMITTCGQSGGADKPLTQIKCEFPFFFGCPSAIFYFWRHSGQLEKSLRDAEASFKMLSRLARGYGIGAEILMKAEAFLMRGEDDKAEVLCYQALYQAQDNRQTCICICARMILAHIAIYRGDAEGYVQSVEYIQNQRSVSTDLHIQRLAELCIAALSLFLGSTENIQPWLYSIDSIKNVLYFPAVYYAKVIYAVLLFYCKRYNEFSGFALAELDDENPAGNIRLIMPRIVYYKYLAVVNLKNGNIMEAEDCFKKALEISLSDRVLLPLAQNSDLLNIPYLIELTKSSVSDKEGIQALVSLCKRQAKGAAAIKKAVFKAKSILTPREREVAMLVKKRYSAQEIAEMLFISRTTAKTIIRNVYSKLGIHSRTELENIEL